MKKEYFLALYTIFCWATLPAITKLFLTGISNMQVLFISSVIAAACLTTYLCITGKIRKIAVLNVHDIIFLCFLEFLGNFLYSALYYSSLRLLPSADASAINYLWPVVASICASVLLHEKISWKAWISLLLSFSGVIIISTGTRGLHTGNIRGILLCASGACCYGIFNVLNKKKGLDQYICTAIYFSVTAICSGLLFFFTKKWTPVSFHTWLGLFWLGIFIDALAILAWGLALQKSNVSILSDLAYLTPAFAALISHFLAGEPIYFYSLSGMALILSGVILQIL